MLTLLSSLALAGPATSTIVLAGDAGLGLPEWVPEERAEALERDRCLRSDEDPVAAKARALVGAAQSGWVLWLGDNVYPSGLEAVDDQLGGCHPGTRTYGEQVLQRQLDAGLRAEHVVFVPGNHDWNHQGPGAGEELRVERQRTWIEEHGAIAAGYREGAVWHADIGAHLRLIAFDSQPAVSQPNATAAPLAALDAEVGSAGGRLVVLASHHPLESDGEHANRSLGGYWPMDRFAIFRADMAHPDYAAWREQLRARVSKWQAAGASVLLVSGHEHSLQYVERAGVRQLVAGSTVRRDRVYPADDARYVASEYGFAALNEDDAGAVWLDLYTFDCGEVWPCGADAVTLARRVELSAASPTP